jgi:hypothetical protein
MANEVHPLGTDYRQGASAFLSMIALKMNLNYAGYGGLSGWAFQAVPAVLKSRDDMKDMVRRGLSADLLVPAREGTIQVFAG